LFVTPSYPEEVVQPESSVSTNDDAFALLARCRTCMVWTLDQTGGRGSRGRTWLAPENHALAMSVGLDHPEAIHPKTICYPILAGLALHEALSPWVPVDRLALKWPNDLLLDGAKLAGILCESRWQDGDVRVVVGIGINLKRHADLDRLPKGYAALETLTDPPAPATVAQTVAGRILAYAFSSPDPTGLNQQWLAKSIHHPGQHMRIQAYEAVVEGTFDGIGDDGALLVKDKSGKIHSVRQSCEDFAIL
jgi:BirA family biotin operon repressor/biotin-[acetyl-CoA-carboxylase] ligase